MVPETDKPSPAAVAAPSDAELMVEICTLVLHDRLAAENHQAELTSLLMLARRLCETDQDIVLDIFLHDLVLESWVLARSAQTSTKKTDHKTMLRSLLGFSPYTAWRRSLNPKLPETKAILCAISASVSCIDDRRPLCKIVGAAHTCPPFALPTSSVILSVHRAEKSMLEGLSLDMLPSEPAALPPGPTIPTEASLTRSLSPSKHDLVHVHSSGHLTAHVHHRPTPHATSPDPRRRATSHVPIVATAPIFIPPPRSSSHTTPTSPPLVSPPPMGTPRPVGPVPALRSRSSSLSRSLSRSPRSCLLGNLEESLLAGSLPSFSAHPVEGFTADISASGLVSAKRVRLPMPVRYYQIPEQEAPSPYVGTIDLASGLADSKGRYRVPANGVLQVLVSNPERTGVKVFMVKYDLRDMPPNTHTFLRQRTYVGQSHGPITSPTPGKSPQYAIHVRFMSSKSGKIYLHKDIRILFTPRAPDMTEYQHTTTDGPPPPLYAPLDHVLTPRVLFARDTVPHPTHGLHLHSPLAPEHHDMQPAAPHLHNPHHHHTYEPHTHIHGHEHSHSHSHSHSSHMLLPPSSEADPDSGAGSSPEPVGERATTLPPGAGAGAGAAVDVLASAFKAHMSVAS